MILLHFLMFWTFKCIYLIIFIPHNLLHLIILIFHTLQQWPFAKSDILLYFCTAFDIAYGNTDACILEIHNLWLSKNLLEARQDFFKVLIMKNKQEAIVYHSRRLRSKRNVRVFVSSYYPYSFLSWTPNWDLARS